MANEDSSVINSLGGRYVLTSIERFGAQASVIKALDQNTGNFVAIKRVKFGPDDERSKEGFHREVRTLQNLVHPNIVELVEVDQDDEGNWYLVLEWIENNLEDAIVDEGAMPWTVFWDRYGSPLLDAIVFGQKQRIAHRDIKPKNILVTSDRKPKLADYGIAKLLDNGGNWAIKGLTFRFDYTPGYTPSTPDDENYIFSRDCFAFAAVAISCVAGRIITSDDDIRIAQQEAVLPREIRPILDRCLSEEVSDRPRLAAVLREQLEHAMLDHEKTNSGFVTIHIEMAGNVLPYLEKRLGFEGRAALERFVHEELEEVCSLNLRESDGDPCEVKIVGATWCFEASVAGKHKELLHITKAIEIGAGHASDLREAGTNSRLRISFNRPAGTRQAGNALEMLLVEAKSERDAIQAERDSRATERVFRAWRSYLRDRADLEANRANAITYLNRHVSGEKVVFTTDIAQKEELVGQDRLIQLANGRVIGVVSAVSFNQVTMDVTYGNPNKLPQRGEIILNTLLAQRALSHQTHALDSVVFGRAVSNRLKSIILEPGNATPTSPVSNVDPTDSDLDDEKIEILSKALGVEDILAIEGPPGTGKTKLISEIVVQWLRRNPGHRILLSSQTHIALDNVLERVSTLDPEMKLIRIGRVDEPKISDESKELLLEKRVESWIGEVRRLAEEEMSDWAEKNGVDRGMVEIGIMVERLIQILGRQQELAASISDLTKERKDVETPADGDDHPVVEDDDIAEQTTQLDNEIGVAERELGVLRKEERRVRDQLKEIGGYAEELATSCDVRDLTDWAEHFLNSGPAAEECRERLSLLEEWSLRVGRSPDFNAALLSSAEVIAGTCVGIAGVKGMGEVSYDLCIVDEASKATATEILIPMARSQRWIVVGDPKQLPPFFEDLGDELRSEFDDKEVKATLLDRLLEKPDGLPEGCRAALSNQYRMVRPIGNLVSECFYDGQLNSPIKTHGLKLELAFPKPVMWYSTHALENPFEREQGPTYCNPTEVAAVRERLQTLQFVANIQHQSISVAVISGYTAQVGLLDKMVMQGAAEWPNLEVSCNSVDAFQGRQADVCIYSVVRSNKRGRLGFLKERPRLNVALSRGKSALLIVGDQSFCRSIHGNNPFEAVIDYMDRNPEDCAMETLS
ncbi:protein kinase [Ruegeria sp. SCSIO 43209]|uniref:serine/threonine-protein kinase n=1 Tax=Ruegeria sp. SCSIO 43209 TaxID=2793010 RepID=UPI001CA9A49E|nr:serine/threonine-protein kinase [Ruegeria sp. SCSIO 43209]UAB88708.1 protein kinase [Ruegeria sp. SCSIO 43209]